MYSKFKFDSHENIDNLLITRRLAQFGPTSLSIDDFQTKPSKSSSSSLCLNSYVSSAENLIENTTKNEYIPPSPSIKIENLSANIQEPKSAFKLNMQHAKHRFGFLLADIKPIENRINDSNSCGNLSSKPLKKMRYELPNIRKVETPIKSMKPLMIVSFSSVDINNSENKNAKFQITQKTGK